MKLFSVVKYSFLCMFLFENTTPAEPVATPVASPKGLKIAIQTMRLGEGLTPDTANALTDMISLELRKQDGFFVVTDDELAALLKNEQKNQLLGCDTQECSTQIGHVAGVAEVLTSSMMKVGTSLVFTMKRVDTLAGNPAKQVQRRLMGGSLDHAMDALPLMVSELFGGVGAQAFIAAPPPVQIPTTANVRPSNTAQIPVELTESDRKNMVILTDNKGNFVLFNPKSEDSFGPFYAGNEKDGFYAQRVIGGGSSGDESFDRSFWEPRSKTNKMGSFSFTKKDGYSIECGDKSVAYKPVSFYPEHRDGLLKKVYGVRWSRRAAEIARNDDGMYWVIDQAREPEGNTDFRLYMGKKGKMNQIEIEDSILDSDASIYITKTGAKLKLMPNNSKEQSEWNDTRVKSVVKKLDLYEQATFIYTALGIYKGESLGTPCDSILGQ